MRFFLFFLKFYNLKNRETKRRTTPLQNPQCYSYHHYILTIISKEYLIYRANKTLSIIDLTVSSDFTKKEDKHNYYQNKVLFTLKTKADKVF